ncbi:DNA mismatch repair protein MutS [Nocardia sp. GAS34]|uniref:MutS-related protein n=1 Tax=unclassified Nocardia TaxID=2637762 RepID=UPI003D1F64F1
MQAFSIVWPDSSAVITPIPVDDTARSDLGIDRVLAAVLRFGDDYDLAGLFFAPVRERDIVAYRQEVFADLDAPAVRAVLDEFAAGMRRTRRELAQAQKLVHPHQRGRWRLDAALGHLEALARLDAGLAELPIASRGLRRWRDLLRAYVSGPEFADLTERVRDVRRGLDEIRYSIRVVGRTVEVSPDDGAPDYSATIANLFARFGSQPSPPPRPRPQWADMNQAEEQILDRVAALHPAAFARLDEFSRDHPHVIDPVVARFDREIQFYLVYLAFARRIAHPLHLPRALAPEQDIHAHDAFDLALASRLKPGEALVRNDFRLSGPERVLVVTGPNQGGKTTFARMFGQLLYFGALGCPVPARDARLPLPDAIFTHFERAEDPGDPDGRLLGELTRMREVLDRATAESVIVMNESFSSTSTSDAIRIGGDILDRIMDRGALALWVTFFDELAQGFPAAVSMVAATASDGPDGDARRTFRIERRPADGQAYALELATRHGLTYHDITTRISR